MLSSISSIWLISSLLSLWSSPASAAAPAGDTSDLHLSGKHCDQQTQVSKSVFGKYTQMYKLFPPTQLYSLFGQQGFARNEETLIITVSLLDIYKHKQILKMKCQWLLVEVGPWAGIDG